MATYERTGLLTYLDEADNRYLLYPITNLEAVAGLEEALGEKLTSAVPVPLEKGGTGATSASAALTKLGAVNKAGDTMTGRLTLPYLRVSPSGLYPSIEIYANGGMIGSISGNDNTRRLQLNNYCADSDYMEVFSTPSASSGLTATKYYELLTSKTPVTVAQGGTGASTAAGARANLGVEDALKLSVVWTNASPGSTFAAQTITLSAASGLDIAFWIVEFRYMASDGGTMTSTIAFDSHNTVSAFYDGGMKSRNVQITGTSAVFKDGYAGGTVNNSYFVPYRIYAVHKA